MSDEPIPAPPAGEITSEWSDPHPATTLSSDSARPTPPAEPGGRDSPHLDLDARLVDDADDDDDDADDADDADDDDRDGDGDGNLDDAEVSSGPAGATGPRKRRRGNRGGRNRNRARRPLTLDGDGAGAEVRDPAGGGTADLVDLLDADDLDEIAISRRLTGLRSTEPDEEPERDEQPEWDHLSAPDELAEPDEREHGHDHGYDQGHDHQANGQAPSMGDSSDSTSELRAPLGAGRPRVGDTRSLPPPPPRRSAATQPKTSPSTSGSSQEGRARPTRAGSADASGRSGSGPARSNATGPRSGATGASTVKASTAADLEDDATTDGIDGLDGQPGGAKRRRRKRGGRGRTRTGVGRATLIDDQVTTHDEIDEELLERRRGRSRNGRPTGRYTMAVHVQPGLATQVAVLEGRQLVEHYVSRPTDDTSNIFGNIYLGRVQNVLPGMEAAFIDIGTPKNGVLYRGDVAYDQADFEGERPRIENVLRNGQSVMVQVTKNPIAHKGARLAQEVSLAGRFVVMVPGQPQTFGISKRLPDDERKRLRKILDEIRPPDAGLIVRTAAEGGTRDELERDLRRLAHQWKRISEVAARSKAPKLLHKEPELAIRIIREEFNREYRGIYIDDPAIYDEVQSYVESVSPELAERVELYDAALPLFERFHVNDQLAKALDRKVWLPSGGSLVIERTEALTVIDVNTGKNVGTSNLEETVYRNNLEAAEEVARQLRLRDVGGIIVIDFIDMEIKKNRDEVMRVFRNALARDKTRTQVFEISELGLVEMTRKRVAEDLLESFSHSCVECHGRGFRLDQSLLELD